MVQQTARASKALPNRLNFTPFALKRIPRPPYQEGADGLRLVRQCDYWDSSVPGFGLRVASTGTKRWTLLVRVVRHGVPTLSRVTIGNYAEKEGEGGGLTLSMARRKAHEYKESIAAGGDPHQMKQSARTATLTRSAQTFRLMAEEFLATHHPKKKTALRPSTLRRYTGLLLGPDVEDWFERPLASLTRTDVIDLLHRMQRRTSSRGGKLTVSVNRMLAVLRKFFRWGIQRNLITTSPANDIEPPAAEVPRDRHLFGRSLHNRPSELALLWRACEQIGPFGMLPTILMLSGQRLNEVAGMREEELIDLDGTDPRWLIPASRTKNGKTHLVPLGPAAVQTIRAMPRLVNCPFIFSTTGTTSFSGFSALKRRIDERITLLKKGDRTRYATQFNEPWRLHDLRRSFKTGLAELGVGSDVRDALVNHTPQGVAAHYDHAELSVGKRAAMETWERHVMGLVNESQRQDTKR